MSARTAPRGTVLVPAHDEEAVIGRCLRVLLADAERGELAVLVVSNGSTDATAARARAAGPDVRVLELDVASKPAALRAGLAAAAPGPVVVIDADIEVPTATVRALLDALADDAPDGRDDDAPAGADVLIAAARPRFETARSSWAVRRYYAVWTALPYARGFTVGGSGVFALSARGRAVLGEIPDVTNDDGWVRRAVPASGRRVVEADFTVHPTRTVGALVARRARVVNGNRELDADLGPDTESTGLAAVLAGVRRRDYGTLDVLVFLAVTARARAVAWWRRRRGDTRWSTDHGSRAVTA
ncbi:glycosyltransferase [Cellulomonas telluris]|uniref:glycosyltransferase n=1 Tax=Cellulomonas telluris TaxID=2306636 RepID=UPI0010A78F74|nr:glycosyltransferase [Cellulomonas telluris]